MYLFFASLLSSIVRQKKMKNEFIIIPGQPTPDELLEKLIDIVPKFRNFWQNDDNLFLNEDRTFSVHGVFAEFSAYIRNNFNTLTESGRKQLFAYCYRLYFTYVYSLYAD